MEQVEVARGEKKQQNHTGRKKAMYFSCFLASSWSQIALTKSSGLYMLLRLVEKEKGRDVPEQQPARENWLKYGEIIDSLVAMFLTFGNIFSPLCSWKTQW